MSGYTMTFTILPLSSVAALLATAAFAFLLGRRLKEQLPAILVAGTALPIIILVAACYDVATDEPDGPPPGMVLIGALAVAALATPITLIISRLAVRVARR